MATVDSAVPAAVDPEIAGKRLLVLGGGLWQREYVRRARQLGAEVWLTDWSPEAVARADADHFAPIDLRDLGGTLAFARQARVDAVLTPADVGVPAAAYVAEALGLPGSSPEVAHRATNKFAMRQQARACGLACPWFARVQSVDDARASASARTLPVIVKPVDSCSSRGVEVVRRLEDLDEAVARALTASMTGAALVEEFVVGREGSIEAFVQDGVVTVLGVCDKSKSPLPDRYDLELRYPGDYPAATHDRLEAFARALAAGFGIRDAILHIEFLLAGPASDIMLIEFALRGCGSKVVTHLLPAITGVDVVHAIIRQALGLRTAVERRRAEHGVLHFLMFPKGRISAFQGLDSARAIPGVIDLTIERTVGDEVSDVRDGRSRPGHLLAHGSTRSAVQRIVEQVHQLVRVQFEGGPVSAPLALPAESSGR